MTAIAFKLLVAVGSGLLGAWLIKRPALDHWSEQEFMWRVTALQLALGLGLFIVLYVLGNATVTSDVPAYYMPAARAVLSGKLPYRDFDTSYAPLFPYVGAGVVAFWNSGKAFALLAVAVNAGALLAWHSAALMCLDRRTARETSLFYATSGHLLVQSLLGTSQVWIAALLGTSALLLIRGRPMASGFTQALAICTTKFLAALFWPALWICSARRLRWFGPAFLATVSVYAAFALQGANLLDPIRREGDLISSGNLPYLLGPILSAARLSAPPVLDAMAAAVLAASTVWLYVRVRNLPSEQRPSLLLASLALTGFVFMLVSKKSFTGYAVFFMYPAIAVLVLGTSRRWGRVGFLLLFNALLATESSIWFHLGGDGLTLSEWLRVAGALRVGGFAALDLLLIACYGYLAFLSIACVRRLVAAAASSRRPDGSAAAACSPV
jgi:hypothetical protein